MKKYFKKAVTILLASFILIGCGESNSNKKLDKESKAYFGILSNAKVKIYGIEEDSKILLFEEETTMGRSIDTIGNFNTHQNVFEDTKFYFYEVSGGENWDSNQDGIIDTIPTTNKRVYKSVYKGDKRHLAWWRADTQSSQPKISEKRALLALP